MKLIRTISLAIAACTIMGVSSGHVSAQAPYIPTLTVTTNGNVVTIQWTGIIEALGYNLVAGTAPGQADIANINLPAVIGRTIVVTAPSGVYYLRVRATAGALAGPFSNEVQVNVNVGPPPPCTPTAPAVTTTVEGPNVTVSWPNVPGATAYSVQYSRYAGVTELAHTVTTNSHRQYVPLVGTFFVRVVAVFPCGQAVSSELTFTVTNINGSGPRTPDPLPGQMLPLPAYGEAVAAAVAAQYPGDLANACGSRTYLYRLVQALRQYDSRWGLNYKRGHWELSTDIVTYNGTDEPDNGADHIYLVDVVSAICEGNQFSWNWHETTEKTWDAAGSAECGTFWCAKWTIDPYLAAGFPADPKPRQ